MVAEDMTGLFGTRQEWSRDVAVSAAAGLFLGLIGPFGSYLNPAHLSVVVYWVGAMLFGALLFGTTLRPAVRLAPRLNLPPIAALALATVVMAIPLGLICHEVALTLWPVQIGGIGLVAWYLQTLVIATPLAIGYGLSKRPAQLAGPAPGTTGPELLDRLPGHLGRDLVALQMEDHYVRAHTSEGSVLLLMPLHQAMAELGSVAGLKIHRSWWVARHAVAGVRQDGRNLRVRLSNGVEAPVSRAKVAAVREAGLL